MDEIKTSDINAENRAEILNIIENFRLMDDTFMSKVFEDKACAELLLRVILNRDDLTVVKVVSQFELKNLQGRSARLDIYAVDEHGKQYDVEVQRSEYCLLIVYARCHFQKRKFFYFLKAETM